MLLEMSFSELKINLAHLDHVLKNAGFISDATWDYDHATYDFKYDDRTTNAVYYLRIRGHVVDGGDLHPEAILQLEEPHIGKHLFPHGIDYQAEIPAAILEAAKKKLSDVKAKLA
ncbi:hypothetical protein BEP19_00790 [Ammoniphilus oxalaticus]|uniref:YugN-like family protein n=1 Tax=Ammoniphilus oxalaticus TaxID=66863 RepID=A0A419SMK0_9BACL|nr:YugN family protein [Ammoniphilus oxalaticus]RKD25515.1 hypothetical protein BEP19_00790 [Ammoniphilus oxalaticus]